ncbi:hypothetical protein DRO49_01375 [Candidatus Bathyarchaeota archaeon]|nr:MAG: hypothetical protein DRO49_01375 [Candidatus Bathyarchaeota archaeon]
MNSVKKPRNDGGYSLREELYWFREAKYRTLKGKRGVQRCYNEMASRYDSSRYLYWTRRMEEGEEKAIEGWLRMLRPPILDVGSGTGRYAVRLADEGRETIALDISQGMMQQLKRRMKPSTPLYAVIGDGENIPLRNGCINSILCTLTFDHLQNPEKAAEEFSRVLRPRGLCIITTLNSHTLRETQKLMGIPRDKIPFRTEDMPPTLIHEVGHSAKEVEELLKPRGFKTIGVKGCCYWHIIPLPNYPLSLDKLLNTLKPLLKYAGIHATLLSKSHQ